jgi:hypothetical protein
MNVEIGAEAALFPEKEYINGIAVAVQRNTINDVSWLIQYACTKVGNSCNSITSS